MYEVIKGACLMAQNWAHLTPVDGKEGEISELENVESGINTQ